MRKIKKINGFLVVKFNDREKREYEGTALGEYGVIDAEVYTGNLDIDRGAMEYDDADTLEVAVELARGLESEEDITDEPPTYTAAVETNESYTEEAVEPTALIEGWTRRLATQVKSKHYPDTDPRTAAHELYGFKMALHQIGFLPESEVITDPDTFGAGRLDGPMPRNPEELLAFVCDERCKNRAGRTQEELDAICAKCPLGQLYEDAEAQDLRIRERSERALQEHIEGVRRAEDTVTALLGGHEALAYRYLSPVVNVRKADNKAVGLHSLALTNTPAIEGMNPIVNSDNFEGGQHSMDIKKLAELLGLSEDATEEQVVEALKVCLAENRSLKEAEKQPPENVVANKAVCELLGLKAGAAAEDVTAKIMELKSGTVDGVNLAEELKALKQQNAEREANDAVILALKAGKITPAQKEWAKSYALSDPKGFGSFVEKAPQIVPMDKIELDDVKALKSDALDADTLLVCKQLGISPDDVKKYGMKED